MTVPLVAGVDAGKSCCLYKGVGAPAPLKRSPQSGSILSDDFELVCKAPLC